MPETKKCAVIEVKTSQKRLGMYTNILIFGKKYQFQKLRSKKNSPIFKKKQFGLILKNSPKTIILFKIELVIYRYLQKVRRTELRILESVTTKVQR